MLSTSSCPLTNSGGHFVSFVLDLMHLEIYHVHIFIRSNIYYAIRQKLGVQKFSNFYYGIYPGTVAFKEL